MRPLFMYWTLQRQTEVRRKKRTDEDKVVVEGLDVRDDVDINSGVCL